VRTDIPDNVESVVGGSAVDDNMLDWHGLGVDTFKAVSDRG
jgi:hypothetical protein